jgi:LPS-assembly protein
MHGGTNKVRAMLGRAVCATAVVLALVAPALAQDSAGQMSLLPPGFFQNMPQVGGTNIAVTADRLTYNADGHEILADGHVEVLYGGYDIRGDHLVFDQRARTAHFVGNAVVRTPDGTVYRGPDLVLSQTMRSALMRQLTITTKGGALIVAGDGDFRSGDEAVLTDSTYAPCGKCIDAKGHRIGWSVKAARMIYHEKTSTVTLEQPSLYLLGIPVGWLPWLSIPDPSKRMNRFLMPSVDYSGQIGAKVSAPYFVAAGPDTDFIFTPSYTTQQGLMVAGEWDQRFPNGSTVVRASGIQQRDPGAFSTVDGAGDRPFRGAIQTYGEFRPTKEWTVGWSYTAFTDPGYFSDYRFNQDKSATNEVYATRLTHDDFFDFRLQQFNVLGAMSAAAAAAEPAKQGLALPNARYHGVYYLPANNGEVDLSASLLGVSRAADDNRATLPGPVPYDYGRQENKAHAMVEADWQKRYIVPGGFVATPFLGLRADAAYADYYGGLPAGPATYHEISLFNATPIAAMDIRYPMVARSEGATHVLEPIAQLVYRGSDVTNVGITNDNAQSFILSDTNLFSYNRFSGSDRQETGLRANVGAHYQVNFDNGAWVDLLGGQSFQLAGVNAFAEPDPTQVTTGQGMSTTASYVVLGAQGSVIQGLTTGAKLQIDPTGRGITRGGIDGTYSTGPYDFDMHYLYVAKNPDRGVLADQHEVGAGVTLPVPFVDYWKVHTYGAWDVAANTWLSAGAGATYDDGYLRYGAEVQATGPTNVDPSDLRVLATFSVGTGKN